MAGTIITIKGNPNGGAKMRERTACSRGHEYVEGSWYWRKYDGTRACRICKQITAKARKKRVMATKDGRDTMNQQARDRRAARNAGIPVAEYRLQMENEIGKKNPLNYLKLNPEQSQASDDLNFAIDRVRGRTDCRVDPAPFMDYDERTPPTVIEAALLCISCPVLEECAKFAEALKPATGVWGGEVWVDGKPQR